MTSTSGISFGGLFSGLDTESIISQLMQLERQPITLLQQKSYKLGYQKEKLQDTNTSLLAVKKSIKPFADGLVFSNKFNSANEAIVSGSADVSATQGTYIMSVGQLSRQQVWGSGQFGAAATPSTGDFTITTKNGTGDTYTISTTGKTLTQIRDAINTAVGAPSGDVFTKNGLAQIITDPNTGNQVLTIKSNSTGTANQFVYANVGVDTPLADLGLAVSQTALDANLTINGVALTSSSDTVTNAITGVTINLKSVGGPVNVEIGLNTDDIVKNVSDFIEKFNAATEKIDTYVNEEKISSPSAQEDFGPGALQSDFDLIDSKSQIRLRTTGYTDSTLATYKTLSMIGIESEQSVGSIVSDKIQFDESKLRNALSGDKAQVQALLEGWADQLDTYLESTTKVSVVSGLAGTIYNRIISIDGQTKNISDDISNWEEKLAVKEEQLRAQFSAMEQALQTLQTQSSYLTSQLANLTGSSSSKTSSFSS
ncbi:MAG: flagellar filament capping protein FliD [bacterium]